MQRFYSFASQMICLLFFSRFPFPAFLLIRLPGGFCTSPNWLYTVRGPQGFLRVSALLRDSVSAFRPACLPLSPFLLVTVSAFSLLSTEKGGHQQRQTWETNEFKCYMASGKGRTPPVTNLEDK